MGQLLESRDGIRFVPLIVGPRAVKRGAIAAAQSIALRRRVKRRNAKQAHGAPSGGVIA
jgi:hypothetical protein